VRTDQLEATTTLTVYNKATSGALFAAPDRFELGRLLLGAISIQLTDPCSMIFSHSLILSTLLIDIAGS